MKNDTKICSRCQRELPLTEFKKRASSKDGHRGICKRCLSKLSPEEYDIKQEIMQFVLDLRDMKLKVCLTCHTIKPFSDFHQDPSTADGVAHHCAACRLAGMAVRRETKRSGGRRSCGEKVCTKCKRLLPLSEFSINSGTADGYQHHCRECKSKRSPEEFAEWRADRERDASLLEIGMKFCRACKTPKPLSEFVKRPDSHDGLQYKCNECRYLIDVLGRDREQMKAYRQEHPEVMRDGQRRRRARKANPGGKNELVKRLVVADRDGWICQHCHLPINPEETYIDPLTGKPNPRYLNMDHWIPLSKGGDHTYENCYASHALCNWRKNAKILNEPAPLKKEVA